MTPAPSSELPGSLQVDRGDSLVALVEKQAEQLGDSPFIRLPDCELSFSELAELARRTAAVLVEHGVARGDIVATLATNSRTAIAAWLGAEYIGAVHLPVNALLWGDALLSVLSDARPRALIVESKLLSAVEDAGARSVVTGPMFVDGVASGSSAPLTYLDFAALIDSANGSMVEPVVVDLGEPVSLLYTSGTTGTPKGVVWSSAAERIWNKAYANEMLQLAVGEGAYTCLPLFHVTGRGTVAGALRCGARVTVDAKFDPFGFWRRLREADAQVFTFVGTILSVLAMARPSADDSDNPVRRIVGAAAPSAKWREVEQRFELDIVETWGQTESAGCWLQPRTLPQSVGTVGFASERWQARLVDEQGRDVTEPGVVGELLMKPLHPLAIFSGYAGVHGVVEPTRECIGDDGWYRTGDLLSRNDDESYSFGGRIREAIRRRGELIAASPIEEAAMRVAPLAEVAAVGVPSTHGSEEDIKLCVVVAQGEAVDPAELWGKLRQVLPAFMVPRYIEVLDELPKTPSTRVRKVALAERGIGNAWSASSIEMKEQARDDR